MQRRQFLRLMALSGSTAFRAPWPLAFGPAIARAQSGRERSKYGRWEVRDHLPMFVYNIDHEREPFVEWNPIIPPNVRSRRNWLMVGNQAIQLQAANDGTVALFDETYGMRWLTAPDPTGTGISVVEDGGKLWGSEFALRADQSGQNLPLRIFGPTWFEVRDAHEGLSLTRTIVCPEGEVPWVLVNARLTLAENATRPRSLLHTERWALRPRFLDTLEGDDLLRPDQVRSENAKLAVSFTVSEYTAGLIASEVFASVDAGGPAGTAAKRLIGPPATIMLERLGETPGTASHRFEPSAPTHPILEIKTPIVMRPGQTQDLWFRFGRQDSTPVGEPASLVAASTAALAKRLPRAAAERAPQAAHEVPWHAAILTGGIAVDRIIGGHTCNQASAYSYVMGFNGAARDPLQHVLPLVYSQPELALSVLRNTCAWATINGELPYALDGAKRPSGLKDYFLDGNPPYRPSDLNLWVLWLAAEYAAVTGDLAAFDSPVPYHPERALPAVPLREHLKRQFGFFVRQPTANGGGVGRGERRHVRIMHADWNDVAIIEARPDWADMIEKGSSVLNSAMAAWVLSIFAPLAVRLGETALANEAQEHANELRGLVAAAWNGRWFDRAYGAGGRVIGGADDMWLEVQPWAILCGAADQIQVTDALLGTIVDGPSKDSPLGTRVRWKRNIPPSILNAQSIWPSINMTLVWAAARRRPEWAWNEWRKMTLASHTAEYPGIWEGTLSGPDAWNPPEAFSSQRGRTWTAYVPPFSTVPLAMQPFPVNNLHSHSQPLLAYLRLLGVEPTARGTLAVGKGGKFRSETFGLDQDGHGSLQARGPVSLETTHGTINGGAGKTSW